MNLIGRFLWVFKYPVIKELMAYERMFINRFTIEKIKKITTVIKPYIKLDICMTILLLIKFVI